MGKSGERPLYFHCGYLILWLDSQHRIKPLEQLAKLLLLQHLSTIGA